MKSNVKVQEKILLLQVKIILKKGNIFEKYATERAFLLHNRTLHVSGMFKVSEKANILRIRLL